MSAATNERSLAEQVFDAKWIVNGFPKSGTHLLVQLLRPIAPYQEATEVGLFKRPWSGTFIDNSWSLRWAPIEQTCHKLARVQNGRMLKTHLGYIPELERWLYLSGAIMVNIYRDLRDVAVSQAYHIQNASSDHLIHPGADEYRKLGGIPEILMAVIDGLGQYPGLIERWQYFENWLNVSWVMSVKYENVLAEPKKWAQRIFRHAMERSAHTFERRVAFDPHGVDVLTSVMARASEDRKRSPTYRAGRVGDWREEFTADHITLWKQHDTMRWLERLRYEEASWYD